MCNKGDILEFVVNEVSDKKDYPDSIDICAPSDCIWDVDKNERIVIISDWKVEAPDRWVTDTKKDKRYVYVRKDEHQSMYENLSKILLSQYNNIEILEEYTELSHLSIRLTPDYGEKYNPDWHNSLSSELYSIMMCQNYHEPNNKDLRLINKLTNLLESISGESISEEHINNIKLLFSDTRSNHLDTVRFSIQSENPQFYYDNVNTLDQYLSKVSDDRQEREQLENEQYYDVNLVFGRDTGIDNRPEIPKDIIDNSEDLMHTYMSELLSLNNNCFFEGESIIFDGNVIETNFWLRQNI